MELQVFHSTAALSNQIKIKFVGGHEVQNPGAPEGTNAALSHSGHFLKIIQIAMRKLWKFVAVILNNVESQRCSISTIRSLTVVVVFFI